MRIRIYIEDGLICDRSSTGELISDVDAILYTVEMNITGIKAIFRGESGPCLSKIHHKVTIKDFALDIKHDPHVLVSLPEGPDYIKAIIYGYDDDTLLDYTCNESINIMEHVHVQDGSLDYYYYNDLAEYTNKISVRACDDYNDYKPTLRNIYYYFNTNLYGTQDFAETLNLKAPSISNVLCNSADITNNNNTNKFTISLYKLILNGDENPDFVTDINTDFVKNIENITTTSYTITDLDPGSYYAAILLEDGLISGYQVFKTAEPEGVFVYVKTDNGFKKGKLYVKDTISNSFKPVAGLYKRNTSTQSFDKLQ